MKEFTSNFGIEDEVNFIPMYRHAQEMGVAQEEMIGKVVAVRFTKAKVMYDICGDYHGKIFDNVDSCNVYGIDNSKLLEDI